MTPPVYEFGPFRYDPSQRLLFRAGGEVVALTPKAVDTLHALIERRGRMVEKAELMKLVWPDTTVEEIGLARNISALRKALGDEGAEGNLYIETVPKRGYRFVAEVRLVQPGAAVTPSRPPEVPAFAPELAEPGPPPGPSFSRPRWTIMAARVVTAAALAGLFIYWQFYSPSPYLPAGPGYASMAMIPFDCLSPELEKQAFSRGLEEVAVAALSKLDRVHVTSPSTVRRYREQKVPPQMMARVLGLDVILEGTLQLHGDRVRVTSRLADVRTGKLIWSASHDYPLADAGAAQSAAAARIAADVGAHLAVREGVLGQDRASSKLP